VLYYKTKSGYRGQSYTGSKHICLIELSLPSKRFCGDREQRITARKMERVEEGGREGRKEMLADKPLDFAVISCHKLTKKIFSLP